MILYISGPMTNKPEFNRPAFFEAERLLVSLGYEVINPARREPVEGKPWEVYMKQALIDLCLSDGVALLSGWTASRGSTMEVEIAIVLGMEYKVVGDWVSDVRQVEEGVA